MDDLFEDTIPDDDYVDGFDDEDLAASDLLENDEELGIDYHEIRPHDESQSREEDNHIEDSTLTAPIQMAVGSDNKLVPLAKAQQIIAAHKKKAAHKKAASHHKPHHHVDLFGTKPGYAKRKKKPKSVVAKLPHHMKAKHGVRAVIIHKKHGKKVVLV